jgi:hypothetical protein
MSFQLDRVANNQIRQAIEHIIAGNMPLNQQRQALPAVLVNQITAALYRLAPELNTVGRTFRSGARRVR